MAQMLAAQAQKKADDSGEAEEDQIIQISEEQGYLCQLALPTNAQCTVYPIQCPVAVLHIFATELTFRNSQTQSVFVQVSTSKCRHVREVTS